MIKVLCNNISFRFVYCTFARGLADMLRSLPVVSSGTHVPAYSPSEDLHHEIEEALRQCGVPSAFRMFVPNECMLCLYLHELVPV